MKSIFEESICSAVENALMPYLIKLAKLNKNSYIDTIFCYIFEAGETITKEEIKQLIKLVETNLSKEYGEKVMTIANTLRQEGEQIGYIKGLECGLLKGFEEGEEKGKLEAFEDMATRLLNKHQSIDAIAELTGLPVEKINTLKQK